MTAFFEWLAQSLWTLFVYAADEALKVMGADD